MFKVAEIHPGAGRKEIQLNPFKWFNSGGGGGNATVTFINSAIQSKQAINLLEVVSEGEIEGFPSAVGLTKGTEAYNKAALKDIFLSSTPIVRPSANSNNITEADFNFKGIKFEPRFGTSDQTFIKAISDIENEEAVGVRVTNASPVTRTISDSNIDAIRVTIRFDALVSINEKDGKNIGTSVDIFIKLTENDGTVSLFNKNTDSDGPSILPAGLFGLIFFNLTNNSEFTIKGKSRNSYSRDFLIPIKDNASFPIQVTVGRDSADSTSERITDTFSWSSFTKIIDEQRPYPDIAHLYLRFDAEQFPTVPDRMYRIRGVKVKIPHNATVDQTNGRLTYSGTFNGTLTTTTHWTSDPAWILFDLLTNSRYGLGDHITETQLDKFAFFSASFYCSELVDDGDGGQEPRFSCNVVLQKREDAFKTVMSLSSVMRGMTFWSAGSLTLSQDRPTDPSYLFNLSNVTAEGFVYSGTSLKTRSTVVSVSYFDMENQELNFETVEDTTAKNKYGIIHKKITGFACTSRNQARRLGRFILFEEQNATETISFATGLAEGVIVRPGQVIEVSDPVKAGLRRGGRISSATTNTVTVDNTSDTDLDSTNSPTLSVIMPDGTISTKNVASISGAVITLASGENFQMKDASGNLVNTAPNSNSVWILENTTLQTAQWRVVSITEDKDNYAITATSYIEGKYAFIEDGSPLPERNITVLNELVDPPNGVTATEEFFVENDKARTRLNLDFNHNTQASGYEIQFRVDDGNFTTVRTQSSELELLDSLQGRYEFRIFSLNSIFEPSAEPTAFTFDALGKTALPGDVQNLKIEPISDQFVRLRFDKSVDPDVIHGGNVVVRSSNATSGATFTNAVDVIPALPGAINETIVPNIVNGTYILKFRDDGGRLSSGDASITMLQTVPNTLPKLTVLEDREDQDSPPFQGTKVDCFFSDDVNGLVLGSLVTLDDESNFDAIADFDFIGAVDITGGSYEFANTLDLGGKQPLRLLRHFVTQGFYPNDLIDRRTANVDTWTDFDAATAFNVGASLLVATTDLDPDLSVSATYGQSGTTITITKTSHGYSVGDFVLIDFTAGSATDGNYEIISKTDNTFTVTSATSATISSGTSCTYGANFTQFNPFVNGSYVARGFKFRCEMDSDDPAQSIEIDQLGYTAEIESRTETSLGNAGASTGGFIASGTSTKSVTFTNSFFTGQSGTSIAANSVLPSIGITIENAEQGDFFALSNISSTGFDIDVKNSSGNNVDRNFKYAATGFGRGS